MLRSRFKVNPEDPRPVVWPIKHPYWVTGYSEHHAIVVAYVDNEEELLRLWPDAVEIDSTEADDYTFTGRFPRPSWFNV